MDVTPRDLLSRARGEYLEMPGLSLTVEQAERLFTADRPTCERLLSGLVRAGFLEQRRNGTYARRATAREVATTRQGG